MKKILFTLLFCTSLFAQAPFTTDNLKNLRLHIINKTKFIDKKQELEIKALAMKKLKAVGIVFDKVDSSTFMIKIESLKVDKSYAVNVQVAVAEEVTSKREEKIETLDFTYFSNDLIDTQEPLVETLESINFLIDGFIELYLEDRK